MILPDKNLTLSNSLLGMGSSLITELSVPQTVSSLWKKASEGGKIRTFDKFVLTLDLLYCLNIISFNDGMIKKQ